MRVCKHTISRAELICFSLLLGAVKINSVFLRREQEDETKSNRSPAFPISAKELEKMPRSRRDLFEDSNIGNVQFIMDKVELRKEVIDVIAPPLAQSPFDRILLEYNRFDREGIAFAIDLLKQNKYVSDYSLIGSPIESDEDLNLLSSIVSTHPSLRELSLAHCASPTINNPARFNPIIPASMGLKTLDLSGNNIESVIIADSLATNPALKELRLRANNFNDDDAELMANALKSNTNLWQLDLKENSGIGRRGCTALLKAIFNHESLNSISSSNHTCDVLVSRYKIPTFNGDVSGGEEGIIRAKKFAILAPPGKQDVNVGLLSGVPLELMHKVLELVQAYPEKEEWKYVEDLLQCKDLLESANHDEDSTDFTHEFMTGMGIHDEEEEEEEEDLQGIPMAEFQRQQAEAVKLAQIKSLSVLMSVVKGVVVPIFFSA